MHVFVLGTVGWGACENICTTSHSCYGNVCCAILRQNKQSGIELTKRHLEDKMHQAQAGVHGMAMTPQAEDLNYLSDAARKEESACFPTDCFINCIFDGVSWDCENWRSIWSHCFVPLGSRLNNLRSDCTAVGIIYLFFLTSVAVLCMTCGKCIHFICNFKISLMFFMLHLLFFMDVF